MNEETTIISSETNSSEITESSAAITESELSEAISESEVSLNGELTDEEMSEIADSEPLSYEELMSMYDTNYNTSADINTDLSETMFSFSEISTDTEGSITVADGSVTDSVIVTLEEETVETTAETSIVTTTSSQEETGFDFSAIGQYKNIILMFVLVIACAIFFVMMSKKKTSEKKSAKQLDAEKRYYTTGINMSSNRYEGNLIRLDNVLDKFDNLIADAKNDMANIRKSVTDAEASISAPFEHEAELTEKAARLEVVNAELLAADNEKNAALEIYETLTFIVPEIEEITTEKNKEGFAKYFVSDNNTMPFIVEALGNGEYLAAKEDKCNGDVMMRGGVTFKVDSKEKSVILTSYRNDYDGEYIKFDTESPAPLGYLKQCLEMVEFIDDNEYTECTSAVFHEKLNASEDYSSRLDRVEYVADKIQDAIDNGELDIGKDEQSISSQER